MAINPFPRPTNFDVPVFPPSANRLGPESFSGIPAFGQGIGDLLRHQEIAGIIKNAGDDPARIGADLAKAGYPGYAEPYLNLAMRKQALAQGATGQAETARHNLQLEDIARTSKVPYGWMEGPEGALTPTPGGPQDPAYIQKIAEIKQKPRELSMTDIGKLSEEGAKFSTLAGFGNQFKDKYAGYVSQAVGGAAMTAGRYLPEGVVGKDISEAAGFWQGYDRFKNVTRNELYGAALTVNEQKAFEQADVNPGMQPVQIRNNLHIQQEIVRNGLKRKANAAITAGYDPATIAAAYGLDLKDLGVDASGRRGTVTPAAPTAGGGIRRYNPETGRIE